MPQPLQGIPIVLGEAIAWAGPLQCRFQLSHLQREEGHDPRDPQHHQQLQAKAHLRRKQGQARLEEGLGELDPVASCQRLAGLPCLG